MPPVSIKRSPSPHPYPEQQSVYKSAKLLPAELQFNCQVYFEECLCTNTLESSTPSSLTLLDTQALNLLHSILASSAHANHEYSAVVAPPHFLSLLATLAVHPTLTTRAKSQDRANVATLSLRYLRSLLETVGPVQANLSKAFSCKRTSAGTRSGVTRKRSKGPQQASGEEEIIENDLATVLSIWSQAHDFWHIVGWAFNCSVRHQRRWNVWMPWVEYMLEALERDFDRRDTQNEDDMAQSLIMQFIRETRGGRAEKRILRALFADGHDFAMNEFPEIWQNELKELKKEGIRKADKIDIDADDYGDYLADELENELGSQSEESEKESQGSPTNEAASSVPNGAEILGGLESLHLRLRFLSLLFRLSCDLPNSFMSFSDLSGSFYDFTGELPLETFFLLMSPSSTAYFDAATNISNLQFFLSSKRDVNAPGAPNDTLTQSALEEYYLPWATNTNSVDDNTRYSLCVEALLRLAMREGLMIRWSLQFQEAVEQGMQRRRDKCVGKRKKKRDSVGGPAMMWLDASEERIKLTLKMIPREEYEFQDAELIHGEHGPVLSNQGSPITTLQKRRSSLHQVSSASPLKEITSNSRLTHRTPSKEAHLSTT